MPAALGATKNILREEEAQISISSSALWVRATKRSIRVCGKPLCQKRARPASLVVHKYFKTLGRKGQCFSRTPRAWAAIWRSSLLILLPARTFFMQIRRRRKTLYQSGAPPGPMKCKIKFYNRILDLPALLHRTKLLTLHSLNFIGNPKFSRVSAPDKLAWFNFLEWIV